VARLWNRNDEEAGRDETFTVLALLLGEERLKDVNHSFIEGLFKDGHEWIPHPSLAVNLIERVVDIKNKRLLKALIDYCVKNAHEHHPGYLTPVIQCQSKLSKMYPDIMGDLFRRTSYIPARNYQYVASHAVIAKLHFKDWSDFLVRFCSLGIINRRLFKSTSFSDINDNKTPIFSLRSQLPFHNYGKVFGFFGMAYNLILSRLTWRFPSERDTEKTHSTAEDQSRRIYVSPFQFKPIKGRNGRQERSFLALIAGKDLSDSPAVVATVQYKW
jgi:hypothetical protein